MPPKIRPAFLTAAAVALLTTTVSSCVDSRYEPPLPSVTVGAADLQGTWRGWAGSSLALNPDGNAEATDLDGQEFRFDDGWRMTGKGTWELYEPGRYQGGNTVGDGSVVHITVRSAQSSPAPSPALPTPSTSVAAEAAARTKPAPPEASWYMGVTKGKDGRPMLFFLTSDPDTRDTYTLSKA
ncbi:hypothetical protein AB0K43_30540 [Kitasatospora sp. NPDC049258]|uniref:hypothetical protein n=1 Tax=Kitasatospora sp. NPDC049258 TaxID=3155394 RepID=UPI00343CC4A5